MQKLCIICGSKFTTYPSRSRKYCSLACAGEGRHRFIRGPKHPNWKGKSKATCFICGKVFEIYPCECEIRIVCSKACQNEWQRKTRTGEASPKWKGGKTISSQGYIHIKALGNPRAHNGYVPEQIIIVEKALRKYLPKSALVHHVNGNRKDNRPQNLVVCENRAYHMLLHSRAKSIEKEDKNARI